MAAEWKSGTPEHNVRLGTPDSPGMPGATGPHSIDAASTRWRLQVPFRPSAPKAPAPAGSALMTLWWSAAYGFGNVEVGAGLKLLLRNRFSGSDGSIGVGGWSDGVSPFNVRRWLN